MKKIILPFLIVCSHSIFAGEFSFTNTDFKELYNNFRIGEPQLKPWIGSWWAYKNNGISDRKVYDERREYPSPANKFDKYFNLRRSTDKWERDNHTCSKIRDPKQRESCEGWWGHCNAWAAAAIKEKEPIRIRKDKDLLFTVADQKAYLTELYMENYSLFVGMTDKGTKTGEWIFDPNDKISKKPIAGGSSNSYDAFWDVPPKTVFLIYTNYIGIQKTSVVIDRFTGEQVWNQPLAGYRLLPIEKDDILKPERRDGEMVYPVLLKMNTFWAEDGVGANETSLDLNIVKDTNDAFYKGDFEINPHYKGRSLAFYLYFDRPLKINSSGKVISSGKMIGDGVWFHQTEQGRKFYAGMDYDNMHPDFIWFPERVSDQAGRNYRNPTVTTERVSQILDIKIGANNTAGPVSEPRRTEEYTCTSKMISFFGREKERFTRTSTVSPEHACGLATADCRKKIGRRDTCQTSS